MKTINLSLVGLNGNAFSLMGAFRTQAEKEGWTEEEIQSVLNDAISGHYAHLLGTLNDHCDNGEKSDTP